MTAMKKEDLERLEREYGLSEDDLSYQHRCSRIAAVMRGEKWEKLKPKAEPTNTDPKKHPLYGKKILITPLMIPDARRNIAFEEPIGHDIQVRDAHAGDMIYGASEEVDRMVGDYVMVHEDKTRTITAKTTFPKIGTEISWTLGKELCPVVRGNDGQRGYLWSFPTSMIQVEDTMIQVYGLKTLITQVWPELLPKFSGKPLMSYIDGITLAASIPMTNALIKEQRRKEMLDAKVGLI